MFWAPGFAVLVVASGLAGCLGGGDGADRGGGQATSESGAGTSGGTAPSPFPADGGVTPLAAVWVHRASGAAAEAADYPAVLPAFTLRGIPGVWGWEPTVAVDRAGALFLSAETNVTTPEDGLQQRAVRVLRSLDGGVTWTTLAPGLAGQDLPPNPSAADSVVHADQAGDRLYALQLRSECTTLHWSDDGGDSWTTNPAACGNPFEDHPVLFSGPAQVALPVPAGDRVVYLCSNQAVATTCKASRDGGVTFRQGQAPFSGDDGCFPVGTGNLLGNGAASEATGTAFVARIACGTPRVSRSADEGLTWTAAAVPGGVSEEPCWRGVALAVDAAGTVFAAFLDEGCLPRLAWSRDDGATWSAGVPAGRPGLAQASHLGLVAGAAGKVAVSYLGTPDGRDVGRERAWSLHVGLTQDAFALDPVFATADPAGRALVVGETPGGAGLDGLEGVGDYLGLAAHPGTGRLAASAVDACPAGCGPGGGGGVAFGRLAAAVQVGGEGIGPTGAAA